MFAAMSQLPVESQGAVHASRNGDERVGEGRAPSLAWAFAKAETPHCSTLFPLIVGAVQKGGGKLLQRFAAVELANLAWAFGRAPINLP
eukprot:gene11419-biopygen6904